MILNARALTYLNDAEKWSLIDKMYVRATRTKTFPRPEGGNNKLFAFIRIAGTIAVSNVTHQRATCNYLFSLQSVQQVFEPFRISDVGFVYLDRC